jgi:chemotaxis response regulator CheB
MQPGTALTPIRVLIADDSTLIRETILKIFRHEPKLVFVGEAQDYRQLIEKVQRGRPDVVLLDMHMPGRSDFDPAFIKATISGVAILCMSIWQDESTQMLAREYGCTLIDKTNLLLDLVPAVEEAVRSRTN